MHITMSTLYFKPCPAIVTKMFCLGPFLQRITFYQITYKQKTWSQSCARFHILKALALPCPSNRATKKAPRNANKATTYIIYIDDGCNIYTSRGVPVALFLTDIEFARFSGCQNQSVKKTPFYVCVPPLVTTHGGHSQYAEHISMVLHFTEEQCKYMNFFLS